MLRTLIHLTFVALSYFVQGQEIVASDGNYGSSPQGSLSWTIGEAITETFSTSGNHLTQGFQQNYEDILSVESIPHSAGFLIFPNPFNHSIHIQFDTQTTEHSVQIYDYQSKLIMNQVLVFAPGMQSAEIDLSPLEAGYYYVRVSSADAETTVAQPILKIQ